ncbi:hypothetical protein ACTXT7_011713 [Hymenolepis weldensis]
MQLTIPPTGCALTSIELMTPNFADEHVKHCATDAETLTGRQQAETLSPDNNIRILTNADLKQVAQNSVTYYNAFSENTQPKPQSLQSSTKTENPVDGSAVSCDPSFETNPSTSPPRTKRLGFKRSGRENEPKDQINDAKEHKSDVNPPTPPPRTTSLQFFGSGHENERED